MTYFDLDNPIPERRPRTLTVLGLLVAAAGLFSYLGAYAVADALVGSGVLSPWPIEHDPRPHWLLHGFVALMILFTLVGAAFRWTSGRQLHRIDEIADAREETE